MLRWTCGSRWSFWVRLVKKKRNKEETDKVALWLWGWEQGRVWTWGPSALRRVETMPPLWAPALESNPGAVSQQPPLVRSDLRPGPRRRPEDGHATFLSQPHPVDATGRAGLPMSLFTAGSPLFPLGNSPADSLRASRSVSERLAAQRRSSSPRPDTSHVAAKDTDLNNPHFTLFWRDAFGAKSSSHVRSAWSNEPPTRRDPV